MDESTRAQVRDSARLIPPFRRVSLLSRVHAFLASSSPSRCVRRVLACSRREMEGYEISRGLAFLGFTRKVLERENNMVDEGARQLYFQLPPPQGIFGVNRDILVDVDETGVWLAVGRRRYGHAPSGQSASTHAPYNVGKKYSVILAIDTGGVVTYLITDSPGTTSVIWYHFLFDMLLPAIAGHPRVILMDNLQAHNNLAAIALIQNDGHVIVRRPAYSCDIGSIEFANNVFKITLKGYWHDLTEENLPSRIEACICMITSEQCKGFFQHTGH